MLQDIDMKKYDSRNEKNLLVDYAALYTALSLIFYCSFVIPGLNSFFKLIWDFLWIFGPPANLLYQNNYIIPYTIETFLIFVCVIMNYKSEKKYVTLLLKVFTVLAWFASGALIYAPIV